MYFVFQMIFLGFLEGEVENFLLYQANVVY